jgi:hypothetical protein
MENEADQGIDESHLALALKGQAAIFDAVKYTLGINRQKAAKGVACY